MFGTVHNWHGLAFQQKYAMGLEDLTAVGQANQHPLRLRNQYPRLGEITKHRCQQTNCQHGLDLKDSPLQVAP